MKRNPINNNPVKSKLDKLNDKARLFNRAFRKKHRGINAEHRIDFEFDRIDKCVIYFFFNRYVDNIRVNHYGGLTFSTALSLVNYLLTLNDNYNGAFIQR